MPAMDRVVARFHLLGFPLLAWEGPGGARTLRPDGTPERLRYAGAQHRAANHQVWGLARLLAPDPGLALPDLALVPLTVEAAGDMAGFAAFAKRWQAETGQAPEGPIWHLRQGRTHTDFFAPAQAYAELRDLAARVAAGEAIAYPPNAQLGERYFDLDDHLIILARVSTEDGERPGLSFAGFTAELLRTVSSLMTEQHLADFHAGRDGGPEWVFYELEDDVWHFSRLGWRPQGSVWEIAHPALLALLKWLDAPAGPVPSAAVELDRAAWERRQDWARESGVTTAQLFALESLAERSLVSQDHTAVRAAIAALGLDGAFSDALMYQCMELPVPAAFACLDRDEGGPAAQPGGEPAL